jgi:hypothetical protein
MLEKIIDKVEESMKETHSKIHELEDKPYVPIK